MKPCFAFTMFSHTTLFLDITTKSNEAFINIYLSQIGHHLQMQWNMFFHSVSTLLILFITSIAYRTKETTSGAKFLNKSGL